MGPEGDAAHGVEGSNTSPSKGREIGALEHPKKIII